MKLPTYLSNSSLQLWETDRREYYLRYLADCRPPKIAQTLPMSVGSSFDGLVKNAIEKMCGLEVRDYSGQIEAAPGTAARDAAVAAGADVMQFYRSVNGISRLLCTGLPRMEFSVEGDIPGTAGCIGGAVRLLGKPDLYYRIGGHAIVHDWKVNGYCSKASPCKGYIWDSKSGTCHKGLTPKVMRVGDQCLMIGSSDHFMWLDQLTSYGWLLGEALGDSFLLQVHQITRTSEGGPLRLTEHRCYTEAGHQRSLRDRYVGCWEAIHSGRCFTDMGLEEDISEQRHLDRVAAGLSGDAGFAAMCGR